MGKRSKKKHGRKRRGGKVARAREREQQAFGAHYALMDAIKHLYPWGNDRDWQVMRHEPEILVIQLKAIANKSANERFQEIKNRLKVLKEAIRADKRTRDDVDPELEEREQSDSFGHIAKCDPELVRLTMAFGAAYIQLGEALHAYAARLAGLAKRWQYTVEELEDIIDAVCAGLSGVDNQE